VDVVVSRFKTGLTPEQIAEDFPSVTLSKVYRVISYYLENMDEVEVYLAEQTARAETLREECEVMPGVGESRARLHEIRKARFDQPGTRGNRS
jgi:hypothetical protein